MDFDLSEEQRLLKDSIDRLIADRYQFEQRKKYLAEPDGWSRDAGRSTPNSGCSGCRSTKPMAASVAARSRP